MSLEPYTYKILSSPGEGLFKDKGSKFISHAYHVANEEDVKHCLDKLRKEYFDARHHCYAYVLGLQSELSRANDDGEPGHSAGDPILGQIRSVELTNTLVVVIRYFGGTKLGVSGLINAYKTATSFALENGSIETHHILREITLKFPYESTNAAMRLISSFDLEIKTQEFLESCIIVADVKIPMVEVVGKKLELMINTGTEISYTWKESKYE